MEQTTIDICDIYAQALDLESQGVHVYSTDECTGMQALERKHPDKDMEGGKPRRTEFEYIRHGTTTLTANFSIAKGTVDAATINPTRTEEDFVEHIDQTLAE